METNQNSKTTSFEKINRKKKVIETVNNLISRDKLDEAMDVLLKQVDLKIDSRDEILLLKSRHSRYRNDKAKNIETDPRELNHIGNAIVKIKNEYYSDDEDEDDDSKIGIIPTNPSIPRNLTFILGLMIFGLAIFSFNQNQIINKNNKKISDLIVAKTKYEANIGELKRMLKEYSGESFDTIVTFNMPLSIWNKSVLIKAKGHYNGAKFVFEGINWVNKEPISPEVKTKIIELDVGERFYLEQTNLDSTIWGVNVMQIDSIQAKVEFSLYKD